MILNQYLLGESLGFSYPGSLISSLCVAWYPEDFCFAISYGLAFDFSSPYVLCYGELCYDYLGEVRWC